MLKRFLAGSVSRFLAVVVVLAGCVAAYAIQPGTTGTEKKFQAQGLRSGVLLQKTNTATATAGAATLNAAGSGVVTSEALTTAAQAQYTLTLTNNMIAAGDIVLASVKFGTATTGSPYIERITPGASSVVIIVRNGQSGDTVLNGTIVISFLVIKQNANGLD